MKTAEEILLNSKIGIKSDWNTEIWDNIIQAMHNYASSRSMESQWISVEDKKPEIGVIVSLVLKHSKEDVYAGFRANGGWYCFQIGENSKYYIPNGIEAAKITHWQPLPTKQSTPQQCDKQ
jgi:hypothetical protein